MGFLRSIGAAIRRALSALARAPRWVLEKGVWVLQKIVGPSAGPDFDLPDDMPASDELPPTQSIADEVRKQQAMSPAATLLRYARASEATRHEMKIDPALKAWLKTLDPRVLHEVAKGGIVAAEKVVAQAAMANEMRDDVTETLDRLKTKYGSRYREIEADAIGLAPAI